MTSSRASDIGVTIGRVRNTRVRVGGEGGPSERWYQITLVGEATREA